MSETARAVLVATLLLGSAGPVRGEEVQAIRLADVIEEARVQNPDIKAARARAQAAAYLPPQVSAYDDPVFSYEAWNTPESTFVLILPRPSIKAAFPTANPMRQPVIL